MAKFSLLLRSLTRHFLTFDFFHPLNNFALMHTIQNFSLREEEEIEDKDIYKHMTSTENNSIRPGLLFE